MHSKLKRSNFNRIDIFIGALEANLIANEHLAASRSYCHDILTWCVRKSQPIPVWKNIFYLCNDPWVYGIFTPQVVMAFCLGYYLQQFERHPKWDWLKLTFNGFICTLGFPCCYDPKTTANRIGFMACLLGYIVITCVISSILMQLAITPIISPQVQSVGEIVNGNFQLVGDRFAFRKISQQMEVNLGSQKARQAKKQQLIRICWFFCF